MLRERHVALRRPKKSVSDARPTSGRQLLIVEPDELTMWSVATYLGRWFSVVPVMSASAARRFLRRHPVGALVLSDALPKGAPATIEQLARAANPDVRAVLLVTETREAAPQETTAARIEKPFELAALARLLGVPEPELRSA